MALRWPSSGAGLHVSPADAPKSKNANAHRSAGVCRVNPMNIGGVDGTRTRDPRRDRPVMSLPLKDEVGQHETSLDTTI